MKIPCLKCGGDQYLQKTLSLFGDSAASHIEAYPCPNCNGTGQIDIPLMQTCPACTWEHAVGEVRGSLIKANCEFCHGAGKVSTEAGQEILELVRMFGKE